ncbi:MAG: ATP-binding protein [Oscillospiraceae bacterium]|nr:ATP-binding protein [Oscillospiraceae bacterium]
MPDDAVNNNSGIGRQTAMVNALQKAVEIFVAYNEKTLEDVLENGLWPFADAADFGGIAIYRLFDIAGVSRFGQTYRWKKKAGGTTSLDSELLILPELKIIDRWIELVSKDICIDLRESEMSADEFAFLSAFDVKSLFLVPIFTYGKLWGVISFEDYTRERFFAEDTEMYRAIARLCAGTIIREENARKADEAHEITSRVLEGSSAMIYVTVPETGEILFANEAIKRSFNITGDVIGQPCYKVFQDDMDGICDFCPCHQLDKEPNKTIIWQDHNARNNRIYRRTDRYIDWPGGKKAHVQYVIDITDTEYDFMKYKLTNDALNIALWDLHIVRGDPINPNNSFNWSQEFRTMLGFSDEEDFPNVLSSWSDRLHPDDKESTLNAFKAHITDCTGKTPYDLVYRLKMKTGEYRYFRAFGDTMRDKSGFPLRAAGALEDIDEKTRMEESLRIRAEIVNANNKSISVFCSYEEKNFDDVMTNGIRPVADALSLDRVGIFRFAKKGSGESRMIYLWDRSEGGTTPADANLPILAETDIVSKWVEILSKGVFINSRVCDMPEDEAAVLSAAGIKWVFIAPAIMYGDLWGAVVFTKYSDYERYYDTAKAELLLSAAHIFANAFIREDMQLMIEDALRESNETLDIMENILNKSEVMIYVTEISTDRLLFITDSMKRHYNIEGDVIGQYCYSVFNGLDKRCDWCPCYQLDKEPDKTVIWEEHSTLTSCHYKNIDRYVDWPDGRKAHIQFSTDITEMKELEQSLLESEKLVKLMLDSSPRGCMIWDSSINVIDCNEACVRLFGVENKQQFLDNFFDFSPEFQPNGQRSDETLFNRIKNAFEGFDHVHEWVHRSLDGTLIPAEVVLVRVEYKDDYAVIAYIQDLREHKKMMREIEQRDKLLNVINQVAVELITTAYGENLNESLFNSMELIGRCQDADFVQICRNETHDGVLHFALNHSWTSEPGRQDSQSVVGTAVPYPDRWKELFLRGECINGPVSLLPQEEQELFDPIKSTITIPLFFEEEFWGIFCVDDCRREYFFSEDEAGILRSAGLMLVTAIYRNEQDAKLNEAHERAKAIMDVSPIGTTLWDRQSRLFDCNEAYVRLFNLKNINEFIERHHELSPERQPDGCLSADKITAMVQTAFDTGGCDFEWMHQTIDGTPIPCHISLLRVAYEDDYAVAGYLRDLREQQKMSSAIERRDKLMNMSNQVAGVLLQSETENFDSDLVHCMEIFGKTVNADRATVWTNSVRDGRLYCTQIYEWAEGVESQINKDLTKEVSYDDVIPGWEETLKNGHCINKFVRDMSAAEQRQLSVQGIQSLCVIPLFLRGHFWGYMGLDHCHGEGRIFDETELDILRSCALMIANTLLRHEMIQEMLRSMEREKDLEIQRQAAQAASDAKTQFLANMSHEIRTPMNAIIGMSDLLLSEDLNIRQHRYAEDIRISGLALIDIINSILDLSKIQTAKLSLLPVHYNIKMLIDHIGSMIIFLIKDKDKKLFFDVDIQSELPECLYGDDVRLRQILLNLLNNAVKYTKKGGIALTIGVDGSNMMITVSDTGMGIPEEDLPILFNAFEQADVNNNRYQEGTGLGLAITKSLVDLMGGSISVESVYGEGSTFTITLPFVPGDKNLIKHMDSDADIVYAPTAKVLVVDDRETNLNVICGLLNQCLIDADKAISGALSIEMTANNQYDLIFMDHMMPEMDGIEATKILRDMGVGIPIIALTANAVSGARELLLSSGMDDFLSKPIDKAELYRVLKEWIPEDKFVDNPNTPDNGAADMNENDKDFWHKIYGIKGLSADIGLDTAAGQVSVYKNTLEIFTREMRESIDNLTKFLADKDMKSFRTEVHGIKGSLSLVGALGMSSEALKLENASMEDNIELCGLRLPNFIAELTTLYAELNNAFSDLRERQSVPELPPKLLPILGRITDAMANTDYSALFDELDLLDGVETGGTLTDEIVNLKEAVQIMNYGHAADIIERLTSLP